MHVLVCLAFIFCDDKAVAHITKGSCHALWSHNQLPNRKNRAVLKQVLQAVVPSLVTLMFSAPDTSPEAE